MVLDGVEGSAAYESTRQQLCWLTDDGGRQAVSIGAVSIGNERSARAHEFAIFLALTTISIFSARVSNIRTRLRDGGGRVVEEVEEEEESSYHAK